MRSARFLNVDIDLSTRKGFEALLEGLGPSILVLRSTENILSFELGVDAKSAGRVATELSTLLRGLTEAARGEWDFCEIREFNIGVEIDQDAADFELPNDTLELLLKMGLSIRLTIYPSKPA